MTAAAPVARVVSQRDLAKMFGVSQVTVSRALRGTGQVKPDLEAALRAAAHQHGYCHEAQFHARSLCRRRQGREMEANVICAIIWLVPREYYGFHRRLLECICAGAVPLGSEVIVAPNMGQEYPRVVRRKQVDGVVQLVSDSSVADGGAVCPVPRVSLLFDVPGPDVVAVDNRAATRALGRHLGRLGHRRFAFLGPDTAMARQRLAGLRQAAQEFGGALPDEFVVLRSHTDAFQQSGTMVAALADGAGALAAAARFTVVAAYNDLMAAAAIRGLRARGVRVPQDVSVVGFDGVLPPQPDFPQLTTVALPLEELGAAAVRLLGWRLRHPTAPRRKRLLTAAVVEGLTTRQVAKA